MVDRDTVVHRLVAILSADAVSYSRLIAQDEIGTVRVLQAHREHLTRLVCEHRGRVVDSPGDNLLAEFPSALDAVRSAVEVQRALEASNAGIASERRMEFRIGVHLGDVMVDGERIYGEGINIAARIERLAQPGTVCVSAPVWEQVRHKLGLPAEDLGDQALKNIPEPVRVYQIRLTGEPTRPDAARREPDAVTGRIVATTPDVAVIVVPAVWVAYVGIVFEILFMISPFGLYYYAAYGPALNVLHLSPWTTWLTDFLLPHFSYTSSPLLNGLPRVGGLLVALGVLLFFFGFVQVYRVQLWGARVVTCGLYRMARHPQYLGLAILGLGAFLVWPRVLVLIAYMTMLFLYGLLARWEERRCLEKFSETYRLYQGRTGMFLPRPLPRVFTATLPPEWRVPATLALWVVVVAASVGLGYRVRDYALGNLSTFYTEDMAVISPARLEGEELRAAVTVATSGAQVTQRIHAAGQGAKLLVYVLPEAWMIADLPLDPP